MNDEKDGIYIFKEISANIADWMDKLSLKFTFSEKSKQLNWVIKMKLPGFSLFLWKYKSDEKDEMIHASLKSTLLVVVP